MKKLLILLSLLVPTLSHAADTAGFTGKITDIVTFPNDYGSYNESVKGLLAIYIDGLPKGCETGVNRVLISVDHPLYESVLSMALYAKASNSDVKVLYFTECTMRTNSWDLANFLVK